MKADMALFESYEIRRVYDEDAETWWFLMLQLAPNPVSDARTPPLPAGRSA